MKVTDHIAQAQGKTMFSFEVIPPQKGKNIQELYDNITPLMEFKPPFIDVTYHREEYISVKSEDGTTKEIKTRKRPLRRSFFLSQILVNPALRGFFKKNDFKIFVFL